MSTQVWPIDVAVSTKAAIQGKWVAHGGGFAWVERPCSRSANSYWTFCLSFLYVTSSSCPWIDGIDAIRSTTVGNP